MRRAGPGPQVSTGRLRVDAGRAIAKLREYQLADRTAWILEAIRAAVAAKATAIWLAGDSNDIWLAWDGPPLELETLPKLFDELVSPAADADRQHVRLLAAGINSALGMEPAYVDLYAVSSGTAHVARYTPDVLAEPEGELPGDAPLRQLTARPGELPRDAPHVATGVVVHLRRRFGLQLLAFALGEPPELEVARQACRDIGVPLHVGDEVLHRDRTRDVLRVPIGEGVTGYLAASDRVIGEAQLEVAEHGVVLARYALKLTDDKAADVPVRLFVDAERMPTNASRSQVRRDKHPISTAETRAKALVGEVVKQLAAAASSGDERARATALAWIATEVGGPGWNVDVLGIRGELRELAKLPLVRNALGEPRGIAVDWRAEVHTGRSPFPSELSHWLGNVLWVPPGDAAARLVDGAHVDAGAMRRLVRWAKREARAQRKFYSHDKREARVIASKQPRVRARLGAPIAKSDVADSAFVGLTGEICVYDEGHGATLVVLLEGRELERIAIKSDLAFDAVIDSATVAPSDRYRGVERDAQFNRVEGAMRLGVVRAVEALAIARKDLVPPDGYELGPDRGAEADAHLFRTACAFATGIGLRLDGPLAKAPAWVTTDGRWVGASQLTGTIGVTRPTSAPLTPRGRTVVYAEEEDRVLLGTVARGRIVRYDRIHATMPDRSALARELAAGRPGALAIPDENLTAAIAPSQKSTLQLRHVGMKLATHPYKPTYLECAIVVDSDAIVPDTDWKNALDDAGLLAKSYGAWELALVRAIAWTIAGERSPELFGPPVIELGAGLGLALCQAIDRGDPQAMLGDELIAKLRAAPIVDVLGESRRRSIAEVIELLPGSTLPFVGATAEPVAGYTPIVAPEAVAKALAKLCGRKASDATGELARRHKRALFQSRLDAHCTQPTETVPPAGNGRVEVRGQYVHGTMVLSDGPYTIRVLVAERPLTTLRPASPIPVDAVVELSAHHCGDTFEGIDASLAARISTDVRTGVPALLGAISDATPERLADPGAARTLLHDWVGNLDADLKKKLVSTVPFRTIQGARTSIEQAVHPRLLLSTADWSESWLPPADGESPTSYDDPVLLVGKDDSQLSRIVEALHDGVLVDASDEVSRLQARRRMARGLLPIPRCAGIAPELRRSLADLPDAKKLGPGEIGLAVDAQGSLARIHISGRLDRVVDLAVEPPIQLAVEEQVLDLDLLAKLARQLVADVVAKVPSMVATPAMRRHLFRAALGKKLDPDVLRDLPICETREDWYPWSSFVEQRARFGTIWAIAKATTDEPLDPERLVFVLDNEALARAQKHGYDVVEATNELALDAQARRNRARPPVQSLALRTVHGVIAQVELDGDGVTAPRGTVAVLSPAMRTSRALYPHRAMHPFTASDDPCAWPTLAVVDDARLEPDRTWSSPKADAAWQALQKTVRAASERALATLATPPDDALVSLRVDATTTADIKELRKSSKSQVRGALWLVGTPYTSLRTIQVTHTTGIRSFAPRDSLAMGGSILVAAEGNLDLDHALEQLTGVCYGKLVRELIRRRAELAPDIVAAHVAHALALQAIKPTEARGIELACFTPQPVDARGWISLVRRRHVTVSLLAHGETTGAALAVVDDGSATARVVTEHLGNRLRRKRDETQRIPTPAPPQPVVAKPLPGLPPEKPAPKRPAPPPREPEPPHPLQGLIERISKRVGELGLAGYEWSIADDNEPMFWFQHASVYVAGGNKKLRALADAHLAKSPWLDDAIDAVAAHVVTVLNVAQTQVTDATEIAALHALLASKRRDRVDVDGDDLGD